MIKLDMKMPFQKSRMVRFLQWWYSFNKGCLQWFNYFQQHKQIKAKRSKIIKWAKGETLLLFSKVHSFMPHHIRGIPALQYFTSVYTCQNSCQGVSMFQEQD